VVAERQLIEAFDLRPEAFEVFLLAAGRDRREGPPVERALEGQNPETLGRAADKVITPRGLDRAFQRLGARIGEKGAVGEGRGGQSFGEAPLAGNLIKIGDMPELLRLVFERGDEMRMGMAEGIDRDTAAKIHVPSAIARLQPDALAALESEIGARVGLEERRLMVLAVSHGDRLR